MDKKIGLSERKVEISLFLICLALSVLLHFVVGFKTVVLNLFYLPVVLAAFYLGRQRAGILALVCVLLASVVAVNSLEDFNSASSPIVVGLALTVWAAVMGLNAIFVGTLSDERSAKINELHDAYLGVVEVLTRYLKRADPELNDRTLAISALSQEVARQMRLSEREVDDIRIASLLQDMEHIEVTAKVIHRAVGDLRDTGHTFQGRDLVHSLGTVLTGVLPLLVSGVEEMDEPFRSEEEANPVEMPFGAKIIRTVRRYLELTTFVNGGASSEEALEALREDVDIEHHPAVVHALAQVVATPSALVNERFRALENLVRLS